MFEEDYLGQQISSYISENAARPPPQKKKKKKKKKKLGQNENGYTKYDNDYILFLPLSIAYI